MARKPEAPGGDSRGLDDDLTGLRQVDTSLAQPADVPPHRPWARRRDARDVERRYLLDRDGWRRRILCARRMSHDAADPVAPNGRWT
jgi:hypothetical protein